MTGQSSGSKGKGKVGRALLWAGSLVLLGESGVLIEQAREVWAASGAATLGDAAGGAALVQRVVSIFGWQGGCAGGGNARGGVVLLPGAGDCSGAWHGA